MSVFSINASVSAPSIILLEGQSQSDRLKTLPSAKELLDLSVYQANMVSQTMCDARLLVSLTMTAIDENGDVIEFDSAEKTFSLPSGVMPDINLMAYAVNIKDLSFGVAPRETRQRINEGAPIKTETIELTMTVKSTL